MDKVSKLNMSYSLAHAQDIRAAINTSTSVPALTLLAATAPAPAPCPVTTIETSAHVLQVDLIMEATTILLVEELTSYLASKKKAWDEEHASLRDKLS